jgi:hypothetical protein
MKQFHLNRFRIKICIKKNLRKPVQSAKNPRQRIFSVIIVATASKICTIQNRTPIVTSW